MNYDDELERARAKRSRKRENNVGSARTARTSGHNGEDTPNLNVEGGSRAARSRAGAAAQGRHKEYRGSWPCDVGIYCGIESMKKAPAVKAGASL